jgi:hypothetical protein
MKSGRWTSGRNGDYPALVIARRYITGKISSGRKVFQHPEKAHDCIEIFFKDTMLGLKGEASQTSSFHYQQC